VAFAEALQFPKAEGSASLMDPFAVPFATPCWSEVAVTELPFDALLSVKHLYDAACRFQ
jgi:hypothetical protein